jgi:hypothetical protein
MPLVWPSGIWDNPWPLCNHLIPGIPADPAYQMAQVTWSSGMVVITWAHHDLPNHLATLPRCSSKKEEKKKSKRFRIAPVTPKHRASWHGLWKLVKPLLGGKGHLRNCLFAFTLFHFGHNKQASQHTTLLDSAWFDAWWRKFRFLPIWGDQ